MKTTTCGVPVTSSAPIKVGDIYRLKFPGFAARVIEAPEGGSMAPRGYPILVESLLFHVRWYINERGEGSHSPLVLMDQKLTKTEMIQITVLVLFALIGVPFALWSRLGN
jgi:hypothetical protein